MPTNAPEKVGSVFRVPLSQLHPHPQNPFTVRDDSAMQELKESVSQNGVLVPAIARPRAEGGYELIAGHRRKYACEQAGQDSMPVIVLNLNDDEAVIQLVDSNIQREDKWDVNMMADIQECIENRADAVIAENRLLAEAPLYPHPASYAQEHFELEQYRASNRANVACKKAIEAAVREHFDGMYLSDDAAKDVIDAYGMERVAFVLANTVQLQDWDGRYSRSNKEWASTIPNYHSDTIRHDYALNSHPAVLDGFIDLVREEQQRSRTQEQKAQPPRASVRAKLQAAPKATSPKRSAKSSRQER